MAKRRRRLLIGLGIAAGLLAAILTAALTAGPGYLRRVLERKGSEALGRELRISGRFDISPSVTPTLVAEGITLANAAWGSEPAMVRVGRLEIALDLASLWKGPVVVRRIAVADARVLLERSEDGRRNWTFDLRERPPRVEPARERTIVLVRAAAIEGAELVYKPAPGARPLAFGIGALDATLDPTHMITASARGHLNDSDWDVAGSVGPIESLYAGRDVDQALSGHLGVSSLSIRGRIRDPLTLGGPNVEIAVDGPDVALALSNFGLRSPLAGPFRIEAKLEPRGEQVAVDATATVEGVAATVRGTIDALLGPDRIDVAADARGPDASTVGRWTGVRGFPRAPFDLAGRVVLARRRLDLDGVSGRVGGTTLTVSGSLGELPGCAAIDLAVNARGTAMSELSALSRVALPAAAFAVRGRFLRRADGLAIDGVEVSTLGSTVHASGRIGRPPACANLSLVADGHGPDASWISPIARVRLPAEPFEVRSQVTWDGSAVGLQQTSGRLGATAFEGSGHLATSPSLEGTSARVRLSGPDLAQAGRVAGLRGLPSERFDLAGKVAIRDGSVDLDDVDAYVGRTVAHVDGRVSVPSPKTKTALTIRGRGAALSDLAAWGLDVPLPDEPFAASGTLEIDDGVFKIAEATVEAGDDRLSVDGTLGALPDVAAFDAAVDARGPSLAGLSRFAPGMTVSPRVPAEPFEVAGRVRRVQDGVALSGVAGAVGNTRLRADGILAFRDGGRGTDLRLELDASDTRLASDVAGVALPEGTLQARGRVLRTEAGTVLDTVTVSAGAAFAEVSGTIGDPPDRRGTVLNLSFEGPDLAAALGSLTGFSPLPAEAFEATAQVSAAGGHVTADPFALRLGDSDLEGRIDVRLEGRPTVETDVHAKFLDVPALIRGFTDPGPAEEAGTAAPTAKHERERVLSDKPLALGALAKFDARFELKADSLEFMGVRSRDVDIAGGVENGGLRVDRFAGTGSYGGRVSADFSLAPDGDGYRLRHRGHVEESRLGFWTTLEDVTAAPPLQIDLEFEGTGRSPHEIAASASGHALAVLGPGRVPNTALGGKSSATLISLMDALNPFRKSTPYTDFECGVAAAEIASGKTHVSPIVVRTDKMTVVGNGKIDFRTEAIDLSWTIKPRRNVGITAGSITNPYIKLGGTLGAPSLDMKPVQAIASTGAAVATAGLTILFKGVYDRITAEQKVCVKALMKAKKHRDEQEASAAQERAP